MARLRLFGPAREAAGVGSAEFPGRSVAEVLLGAEELYGPAFAEIVAVSNIWVNGDSARPLDGVGDHDEVAVIPPVSGG
ncbi:MAG: MoaD/ThiS family protein [Acidimicrobiales bacterium]